MRQPTRDHKEDVLFKKLMFPILLATTALAPAARAQVATASSDTAPVADTGLEEVVVTAQRRSENVLTVPMSISVVSGKTLQETGLTDISSLAYNTPGLIASDGVGYTQLYIRGVGNGIFVGADPSVATFVDDIPRIYGSMINSFIDVDRVEVLKGAQGGLYGRNATGGVVNIVTLQPSDDLITDARFSYGQKKTFEGAAYVNIPLTDAIAWNVSIERQTHDPYVTNLAVKNPLTAANFPGNPNAAATAALVNEGSDPPAGTNNRDFVGLDSKLRVKIGDNFKTTLGADYALKNDSDGNGWYNTTPKQTAALLTGSYYFGASTTPPVFPGGLGTVTRNFTNYSPTPSAADITDYGVNDTSVLSLPGVDLTSITSYRRNETFYEEDSAGSSVPVLVPFVDNHKWNAYQELRAVSTGDARYHFVGGATYLDNNILGYTHVLYINNPLFGAPVTTSIDRVHSWSVYGQAAYDLTDRLTLTGSLRYVHEVNAAHFFEPADSRATLIGKKALPSATLDYKVHGGTVYARYAEGYKTGGVNPTVPPSDFVGGVGSQFGPEKVDTYEVGFRAPFFDNNVQLTTAVFYNKYQGLQTITNGDATHLYIQEAIINAGSARTYGAEGSVTWRVAHPLTLGANVGYLNAKYLTFELGANSNGLSAFNYSGQTMLFSPEWQGSLNATFDQPITDKLHLTGNLLWSYISRTVFFNSALAPYIPDPVQPGYSLTNIRFGIQTADQRVGFNVYANNVFDKGYTVFGGSSALGNQFTWGNPRIVGGEVTMKF
jgi:iron complex outermembrane recepter protein